MVKLDRFLVSSSWEAHFPRSVCNGKARIILDHIPICLDTLPPGWSPFPFKFYKSWLCKEGFEDFVNNLLPSFAGGADAIPTLASKLKMSELAIKEWLSSRRFDHQARLIEIEDLIQGLDLPAEAGPLSQADLNRKYQLRSEHFNILRELELYWRQRSRIQWLKEGDLNTAFFHKMANLRRRINIISSLSIDGIFSESPVAISLEIENFFRNLYNKPASQALSLNWNLLFPV